MSKPNDELRARQIPSLKEQMEKPKYDLSPDWSEHEYNLISKIWDIFKNEPGTSGKKKAVQEIRFRRRWTGNEIICGDCTREFIVVLEPNVRLKGMIQGADVTTCPYCSSKDVRRLPPEFR